MILFSVIAGIGALVVTDMASEDGGYNRTDIVDPAFDSAYNKIEYASGLVGEMGNSTSSKEGLSTPGTIEIFFGSTITVFQLIFGSFAMANNVFTSMGTSFGIPPGISNLIFPALLAIITTIIVFVIISSLTKSKV